MKDIAFAKTYSHGLDDEFDKQEHEKAQFWANLEYERVKSEIEANRAKANYYNLKSNMIKMIEHSNMV